MKYLALLILLTFLSCKKERKKPFVIINKTPTYFKNVANSQYSEYEILDANGEWWYVIEKESMYCIGDTIK